MGVAVECATTTRGTAKMPLSQRECRADVYEDGGAIVVEIDLPGVAAEDIRLKVDSYLVSVQASIPEEDSRNYHRRERGAQRFFREIPLPVAVRRDTTTADLRDGVLIVRMRYRLQVTGAAEAWRIPVRRGYAA